MRCSRRVFHALVSADSVVGMISVVREADDLTLASCESRKHPETCAADRAYASVVITGLASRAVVGAAWVAR